MLLEEKAVLPLGRKGSVVESEYMGAFSCKSGKDS